MRVLTEMSQAALFLLNVFFFIASLSAVAQLFYDGFQRKSLLIDTAIVLLQFLLLINSASVGSNLGGISFLKQIPWIILFLIGFNFWVLTIVRAIKTKKRKKQELSPNSIKQFIDDMPMALCFADPTGRVVLCNREMIRLSFMLTDAYPQMLSELIEAIQKGVKEKNIIKPEEEADLFRFPDGTVRMVSTRIFTQELQGWTQTTISNVDELYEINEMLKKENKELRKTNKELQQMYAKMEDAIREKESLELKIYIHDSLGRSLLTIRDILERSSGDMDEKVKELAQVVEVLSENRPLYQNTIREAEQKANEIGVKLELDGYVPSDRSLENLIVAAIRECATNCVRHAHGDLLKVTIRENEGICTTIITNNGDRPKGPIKEGTGLSSLRRSIEAAGGEMYLSTRPEFALIINLKEKGGPA